jgi:hypothetical protein
MRRLLMLCGGGGLVALLTAMTWPGAVLVVAVLIVVATICWIVGDDDRPNRFAAVLTAWRGPGPGVHRQLSRGRRARTVQPRRNEERVNQPVS